MAIDSLARSFFRRNRKVFELGLFGLMISSVGDLLAGATLGYMTDTLQLLPGLMILIPPAIGMRGNIFGALGSRLGTSMHIGTFDLSLRRGSILRQNIESSLLLTMVMSFLMGFLAKAVSVAIGVESISVSDFIFISVLGGVLAGVVLLGINVLVATIGYRRNWDIDNFSAPVITAAGDIVTLPMLFIAALIVSPDAGLPQAGFDVLAFVFLGISLFLLYRVLRMRRGEEKRIFLQSAPVLLLCILLDIGAGLTIDNQIAGLVTLPALLVMIPPFLEDANALGGILTSRFASMLHMGVLPSERRPGRLARENFAIIYLFSLWVFTLVGVTAYLVGTLLNLASPPLLEMVLLSLTAGLLTVTVLNVLSYYVAELTFHYSLDPDDHSIPLTSSAIDFAGSICLIGMLVLFGLV
jgi:mgtE-like transporter